MSGTVDEHNDPSHSSTTEVEPGAQTQSNETSEVVLPPPTAVPEGAAPNAAKATPLSYLDMKPTNVIQM